MAIIQYSGLVNRIMGKIGNIVYSQTGPSLYLKTAPTSVAQPNTYRQLQVKANFCTVVKLWTGLPESYKELWDGRASCSGKKHFGQQSFTSLNCNLLNASHSGLTIRSHPPLTPSTPEFPKNFCVFLMSPTSFCLSWTSPHTTGNYVSASFRLHKGFCLIHPAFGLCPTDGYRPSFRFIETVRSDTGCILFSSNWPANTRLFFKLHSMDSWGRRSPWTHVIPYTQP